MWTIIATTWISEPISVTYLTSFDSDLDTENLDSGRTVNSKASGSTTKVEANKWHICLENGTTMMTTGDELMNASKFFWIRSMFVSKAMMARKENNLPNKREHVRLNSLSMKKGFKKQGWRSCMSRNSKNTTIFMRNSCPEVNINLKSSWKWSIVWGSPLFVKLRAMRSL